MVTAKLLSAKNSTKSWVKQARAKLDSKSFGEQIRKQLDALVRTGKFYVNLSKINIGAGAIADFRRQLNTVTILSTLIKGQALR